MPILLPLLSLFLSPPPLPLTELVIGPGATDMRHAQPGHQQQQLPAEISSPEAFGKAITDHRAELHHRTCHRSWTSGQSHPASCLDLRLMPSDSLPSKEPALPVEALLPLGSRCPHSGLDPGYSPAPGPWKAWHQEQPTSEKKKQQPHPDVFDNKKKK